MTFAAFLSDEELARLKYEHPALASGVCPTCKGRDDCHYTWEGQRHRCDCQIQKRMYTRYLNAGIGLTYQRLSWGNFSYPIPPQIIDYLDHAEANVDRGMGLFLTGPMGVGKTMLAMLVLKDLVKQGYNCYATTFANTVEAFTSTWGDNEEKKRFADRFMYSDVLLLDDLGQEQRTASRLPQTTFDRILRTRIQDSRPTILTTNLKPLEVKEGYGAPVLSLLTEQSIEIQCSGGDFRPQAHDRVNREIRAGEVPPIS